MKIWGLIEMGSEWWDFNRHEISHASEPPNALTILSRSPGELVISRSGRILIVLSQGEIHQSQSTIFAIRPIVKFFNDGVRKLDADYHIALQNLNPKIDDRTDLSQRDYIFFIERLLNGIREKRHGGTILIIPDEIDTNDTRLKDRINIKYKCKFEALSILVNEKSRRTLRDNTLKELTEKETITKDDFGPFFIA